MSSTQPKKSAQTFGGIVGGSPTMLALFEKIKRASRYKVNVLLLGESGTGKELIARALHETGPRRAHRFVPVNCAAIGHDLLENELFGHEKGAFTGANERKKGLFELADGGTLFLDEISEIDPSTQAKLLRALERNEFRRVGGTEKLKVDLSVIAATNRNLTEAISTGRFREDLYYRIKVLTLSIPPLRERREDIPALVATFVADFNRRYQQKLKGPTPAALSRLVSYHWPGNVRELKNVIESTAVLATRPVISLEDIEAAISQEPAPIGALASAYIPISFQATLEEAERQILLAHLEREPSKSAVARALGIGLRTIYTKLQHYQAHPPKTR